jgi:hypothetical protein
MTMTPTMSIDLDPKKTLTKPLAVEVYRESSMLKEMKPFLPATGS